MFTLPPLIRTFLLCCLFLSSIFLASLAGGGPSLVADLPHHFLHTVNPFDNI